MDNLVCVGDEAEGTMGGVWVYVLDAVRNLFG